MGSFVKIACFGRFGQFQLGRNRIESGLPQNKVPAFTICTLASYTHIIKWCWQYWINKSYSHTISFQINLWDFHLAHYTLLVATHDPNPRTTTLSSISDVKSLGSQTSWFHLSKNKMIGTSSYCGKPLNELYVFSPKMELHNNLHLSLLVLGSCGYQMLPFLLALAKELHRGMEHHPHEVARCTERLVRRRKIRYLLDLFYYIISYLYIYIYILYI